MQCPFTTKHFIRFVVCWLYIDAGTYTRRKEFGVQTALTSIFFQWKHIRFNKIYNFNTRALRHNNFVYEYLPRITFHVRARWPLPEIFIYRHLRQCVECRFLNQPLPESRVPAASTGSRVCVCVWKNGWGVQCGNADTEQMATLRWSRGERSHAHGQRAFTNVAVVLLLHTIRTAVRTRARRRWRVGERARPSAGGCTSISPSFVHARAQAVRRINPVKRAERSTRPPYTRATYALCSVVVVLPPLAARPLKRPTARSTVNVCARAVAARTFVVVYIHTSHKLSVRVCTRSLVRVCMYSNIFKIFFFTF